VSGRGGVKMTNTDYSLFSADNEANQEKIDKGNSFRIVKREGFEKMLLSK
jgi:hypothetical protein